MTSHDHILHPDAHAHKMPIHILPIDINFLFEQFVELKASVFKKFEKSNLFQMSCSDVRERFHLMILLMIVGIRNLTEFSWNMGMDGDIYIVSTISRNFPLQAHCNLIIT